MILQAVCRPRKSRGKLNFRFADTSGSYSGGMLNSAAMATVLIFAFLSSAPPLVSRCGASPEKGWVEFVDRAGYCFWYPPRYKREAAPKAEALPDRQTLAILVSSELRQAFEDDKAHADIGIYLLPGAFNLSRLIPEAPTGVISPPTRRHYGPNVFYYYGAGGGGVAYPDRYYFNLRGRDLQIVFNGQYSNSKSPNAETQADEKIILSSFKAAPR
jgi:hypothetical protein